MLVSLLKNPLRSVTSSPFATDPGQNEILTPYGRSLNGTNQYFSIADNADLSVGGDVDFTFFGWCYVAAADNTALKAVLGKGDPFAAGGEYLAWLQNNVITWAVRLADDSDYRLQQFGGVTYPSDEWFTLELSHNKTDDKIYAYINGQRDTGSPSLTNGGVYNGSNSFFLGRVVGYGYMKGSMSRWGLWKKVFSDAERIALNASPLRFSQMSAGLKTNLVASWNLEEEDAVDAEDFQGSNDLTQHNSPARITGPAVPDFYSKRFTGSTQCLYVADHADFNFSGDVPWDINFWVKPTSFADYRGLITKGRHDFDAYINLTDGKVSVASVRDDGPTAAVSSDDGLTLDDWNFVSFGFDPVAGELSLYVNGVTKTTSMASGTDHGAGEVVIGALGADASNYVMAGMLALVRIHKGTALTETQRDWLAAQPRSLADLATVVDGSAMNTNLVLSLPFTEIDGATDEKNGHVFTQVGRPTRVNGP